MKLSTKLICLLPLFFLILELIILHRYDLSSRLHPLSSQNQFLADTKTFLSLTSLEPITISSFDSSSTVELTLLNNSGESYPIVFSTQKSPLLQVTALQKLIKIANIKGKDIHFIDFSSPRPYATL